MNFILVLGIISAVIPVGPNKAVKDLSKVSDGNEYVLDAGTYKWGKDLTVKKSFSIHSADPSNRAVVQFPNEWGVLPTGVPDEGSPKGHSIICSGSCVMKDLKITGGEGVVVFGTNPGSSVLVQHIDMDGGGIIRAGGAKTIQIINVQSSGRPTAYFIANFTNQVDEFLIDLSANTMPVCQGGHAGSGKPTCTNTGKDWCQGEAAIRIMDTKHLVMKSVNTVPWLYDGKHAWKQDLQLRGLSGKYEVSNSSFNQLDSGAMTWQNPPPHLDEVDLTDCTTNLNPNLHPGIMKIVYKNTKIKGVVTNQTKILPSYSCPSDKSNGCKFN